MSAASVEAFTNDLLAVGSPKWLADSSKPRLQLLARMLERLEESNAQVLLKYEAIHFALDSSPLPLGQEPFQSLRLLIDIRNRIVHCRPLQRKVPEAQDATAWEVPQSEERYIKRLAAMKLIPSITDNGDWMDAVANRRAVIWAIATAADIETAIVAKLGDDPSFQAAWAEITAGFEPWFAPFRHELKL